CFNYLPYAQMASKVAKDIKHLVNIPVLTAMSKEMEDVIATTKDEVPVVKMPKKGETGLNDSLKNICMLANALHKQENVEDIVSKVCY
ncbi:MAG: glycine/betaine/sarcosine/D-proline reductase family selenoprotein B, partial [Erysipelotrichaceae bacterium]|nr:glycine/betaine/sarcosine/D-proline reductase family selenoprotein B [Erysipelotrichaceae bacterium]